ncbi:hypothetical protein COV16_03035 [Candidatus Woesearchaeota archaeon CG10_big_fil_rev_8_21_14_0_10_34_8]|nr:MAG: hypothetical protein COV16_03035 [Candidatus Woesearchaeota archaeon CG10_big_fil_rev_8_21_14_0_10_34_8]
MKKYILMTIFILSLILISCSDDNPGDTNDKCGDGVCDSKEINKGVCPKDCGSQEIYSAGDTFITYINSEDRDIAVQITLPYEPRYLDGAPVLVYTRVFFTPYHGFGGLNTITEQGFVHVTYLWPGETDRSSGVSSEGVYDYGDEASLRAFRDVIKFAMGELPNVDGYYINELSEVSILTKNVGLYAFSHPGIAATNVLAFYQDDLFEVDYFVGGENPTVDTLSSVEVGHWAGDGSPVYNPYYTYPDDYTSTKLLVDYSNVAYDFENNVAYFDINADGSADESDDFILGSRIPQMYDKRYYSMDLTQALYDNGALDESNWPSDLATPEEAAEMWPFRSTVDNYDLLKRSGLKVMLVFARDDHVQPSPDKPNIHMGFDGFYHTASLWVRLNPDTEYIKLLSDKVAELSSDNNANSEPSDWLDIRDWAYTNKFGSNNIVPLAAVMEMADRTYYNNWDDNLDSVLN